MAVITEAAIRELAGIRSDIAPITSCYLDVDGRRLTRHQDVEHELDGVLRDARMRANGHRSVHDDLRRIEAFVKGGFDRHETRGLAIFACAGWITHVPSMPISADPSFFSRSPISIETFCATVFSLRGKRR